MSLYLRKEIQCWIKIVELLPPCAPPAFWRHFVLSCCVALILPSSASGLGKASYTEKGTAELAVFASAAYAPAGSAALYYGFAPTFNYFFADHWYVGGDLGLYYYFLDSGNYQNIKYSPLIR